MKTADRLTGQTPAQRRRIKADAITSALAASPKAARFTASIRSQPYTITATRVLSHPEFGLVCWLDVTGPDGQPVPFANPLIVPDPPILVPTTRTSSRPDPISGAATRTPIYEENLTAAFRSILTDAVAATL